MSVMELWLLPSRRQIEALNLDQFATMVRRADPLAVIDIGLDAALRDAYGWRVDPPWAALLAGDGAASATPWLAADLVHVRAESVTARVMALAVDQHGTDADLASLFDALKPWLADEAIELAVVSGGRALLRCAANLGDPGVAAPDAVLGRDLRDVLPRDRSWQRRFNEMQIVLTQQSSNESRSARQLPVWNTLWFWGMGSADSCPPLPVAALASSDPLLRALAAQQGLPVIALDQPATGALLRDLRDPRALQQAWNAGIRPRNALLRCVDGGGWRVRPWQRLRVWR